MPDLTSLPDQLDATHATCRVVIETPKGPQQVLVRSGHGPLHPPRGAAGRMLFPEPITSINDVSRTMLSQLEEFFISYNRQRGMPGDRMPLAG
jgi:hypothetical protein